MAVCDELVLIVSKAYGKALFTTSLSLILALMMFDFLVGFFGFNYFPIEAGPSWRNVEQLLVSFPLP